MDVEQLESEVERYFDAECIRALRRAHQEAYDRAAFHYSPDDGADAMLFGLMVYKYIRHRLAQLPDRPDLDIEIRAAKQCFRLGVGPFTVAPYSCGRSAHDDIYESFPNNENGAPALVDLNLEQLRLDLQISSAIPRALVLAHFGNPVHGLEALYLAAPISKQDGRICDWNWTKQLWRWEGGEAAEPTVTPDLPRPARIAPAPLVLKIPAEKPQTSSDW